MIFSKINKIFQILNLLCISLVIEPKAWFSTLIFDFPHPPALSFFFFYLPLLALQLTKKKKELKKLKQKRQPRQPPSTPAVVDFWSPLRRSATTIRVRGRRPSRTSLERRHSTLKSPESTKTRATPPLTDRQFQPRVASTTIINPLLAIISTFLTPSSRRSTNRSPESKPTQNRHLFRQFPAKRN